MKTLDTQQPKTSDSVARFDFSDPKTIRSFAGNFYIGLGWFDVASSVISLLTCYWTDQLHITFSFILFFWLGRSLKEGVPAARKWAIGSSIVITVFCIAGFFLDGFRATVGNLTSHNGDAGFAIVVGLFVTAFAVPAVVLFGERGRQAFPVTKKQNETVEKPRSGR